MIDSVLEQSPDRIVAVKQVCQAEEYLADHFPKYPILPGVLMLETMVQAARELLTDLEARVVLSDVRAFRFSAMVRPGETLIVEVEITKRSDDGRFECRGTGRVRRACGNRDNETAASGRFTMRPVRP